MTASSAPVRPITWVAPPRSVFDEDHDSFRDLVRAFVAREVVPHLAAWDAAGRVDRSLYLRAGEQGLLGFGLPEEVGGGGIKDFRFNAVLAEELAAVGAIAVSMNLAGLNDLVVPYLSQLMTSAQLQQWAPRICTGEIVTALALTEPGAGSDLRAMRTTACFDGDGWVLDGAKTFISNGLLADLVVVAARTGQIRGRAGISLFLVERGMPGFERGAPLAKTGLHAQDTAELSFTGVRLSREHLLGEEGRGFSYLMANLPTERLSVALTSIAACEAVLEQTLAQARERTAFGQPVGSFQHNRFVLATVATEVRVARVYIDDCLSRLVSGGLSPEEAAMAKWWITELQQSVTYRCQQLWGGYGVMSEYAVARAAIDARPSTIYAGTTEILKEIIGRSLGL